MSTDNKLVKMDAIETDVTINMEDIVSIFVTKHEDELYENKTRLTAEIAEGRKVIAKLTKDIVDGVSGDKFIVANPLFETKVSGKQLNESAGVVTVSFKVTASKDESMSGYGAETSRDIKVTKKALKGLSDAKAKLDKLAEDLNATMVGIRDIGRKERQVKARITERKLESMGMDILKDKELQKMISL